MDEKKLNKCIVLLLLSNKNKSISDSYSLIKALSRWFNIINFVELMLEMTDELLISADIVDQQSRYALTRHGKTEFRKNQASIETELRKKFPLQEQTIDVLFSNLEY
ncbi:MAG: hypothetical protein IAF38_02470 [Bacteroidia bacterium]|nr:hypothetical protein [Bacteroidia bacterium]